MSIPDAGDRYTLSVVASGAVDPASPVVVDTVVYGDGDANLKTSRNTTPFEVDTAGKVVVVICQAVDPLAMIGVEVAASRPNEEVEVMMTAAGRTVVVGVNLVKGVGRFIRTTR